MGFIFKIQYTANLIMYSEIAKLKIEIEVNASISLLIIQKLFVWH